MKTTIKSFFEDFLRQLEKFMQYIYIICKEYILYSLGYSIKQLRSVLVFKAKYIIFMFSMFQFSVESVKQPTNFQLSCNYSINQ